MNIDDVLKYTPSLSVAEEEESDEPSAPKRSKLDVGASTSSHLSSADIDKIIEEAEKVDVKEVNEADLKRLIGLFERRLNKNQEMRIKHSDNPAKFMDSELELFDTIIQLHSLTTYPSLYHFFIEQKAVPKLLGLFSHENTDLTKHVASLIMNLTDLENIEEMDDVSELMEALFENQILQQLVTNLERLDEKVEEESEAIHYSLGIIDNLTEYKSELGPDVKPLISWLLKKLKMKPLYNQNKQHASEILNVLLQNDKENRLILGSLNGIDILLRVASYYKKHDPASEDEEEFMANVFNCICSAVQSCDMNRELFYKGEGLELMNLILKEKRQKDSKTDVRLFAFKVLNHSLSTENPDELLAKSSDKFVEILGLRVLMPVFQKPSSILGQKKKKKNQSTLNEVEEHSVSVILTLLRFCKPENLARVLNKFVELNMVKTERLVEMYLKYSEEMISLDDELREQGIHPDNDPENEELFRQSNATQEEPKGQIGSKMFTIKERILKLLNMHKHAEVNHVDYIRQTVIDYAKEKNENEAVELSELVNMF
ncbi:Beta-catenin-like protein 1 [Tyrophagus putrescentiae]|nr:Beta-catenin-like protein 1 [Tyrophagus putrescentiae]